MMVLCLLAPAASFAQSGAGRPEDTEVWAPEPPRVTPAMPGARTPADAVVLFDGKAIDQWASTKDGSPATWTVADGAMIVRKGASNIQTRRSFGNYQLHLEWRVPAGLTGTGQGRGNSGVFLAATGPGDAGYELQILDSWHNATYVNGQAGSLYKQFPPLVNAVRPPGKWQSYDVVWTAPTFDAGGALVRPASATALLNGVVIQDHATLRGETVYIGRPRYHAHGGAPIKLQDHGAAIAFRNIWVRDLP